MQNKRSALLPVVLLALGALLGKNAGAVPFGTFDARSLAMGGAGVASATSANAAYYNPALMARYKTRKEIGHNSRYVVPLTLRGSRSLETIAKADEQQLEQNLVNSIADFNANQNSQTARQVLGAATELQSNLDTLLQGPVQGDIIYGIVLGIGHKHEGGAIIINQRLVGDGAVDNFASDIQLLGEYVDAMTFIEGGGNPADAATRYPNVVNPDGTIADQTGNLTSAASGSGLIMTEIGMAMSKEFKVYGIDLAFGITPKVQQVVTYDFSADASTGESSTVRDDNQDWEFNMDFGIAHQINHQWRAGLVIKNLRTIHYTTSLGNAIDIGPQIRAGSSYDMGARGLYAIDVDLLENDAVGGGSPSRVLSLGGEWPVLSFLKLRGGMTRNMKGAGDANDVLYTFGVHSETTAAFIDLTLGGNSFERAYAVQIGIRF